MAGLNSAEQAREDAAAGIESSRPPPRRRFEHIGGWRNISIQAAALIGVAAVLVFLAINVANNVSRLGIETGFEFLFRPAGFPISQTLIPYSPSSTYLTAFFVALLNTVVLAAICIVLSTALGLLVGLARLSANPMVSGLAASFVEAVRNVPLLLHLLAWYFIVLRSLPAPREAISVLDLIYLSKRGLYVPAPEAGQPLVVLCLAFLGGLAGSIVLARAARARKMKTGRAGPMAFLSIAPVILLPLAVVLAGYGDLTWSIPELRGFNYAGGAEMVPEFVAMTVGLSVYSAAFIAEIFRGGFNSVPRGQREGALSLGLPAWLVNLKIVIPLALRAVTPPLGAQYVLLLKNSSLAAAIAYPDLMLIFAGTALNQTGQPLEVMFITLSAYLILGLLIAMATNAWNRRLALVSR